MTAHAFATQAAQNSRLQRVCFWTTPDGGGTGKTQPIRLLSRTSCRLLYRERAKESRRADSGRVACLRR